ncbi:MULTISPECIES: diguanylate cyclase [Variovorax]|jgi:diguanylate cyclase|uniref:diguanylate cyclase n=2 Tax=Comamonadaceae TaxID=80864 RepID=UPI000AB5E7C3|nr:MULTISPECIES: diguanylate cyclase [Variovorax]MBN8755836.1 GGDEF domain-containing protein [Variovorax sp.]UKI06634.1 sensor domain-containing diguanylate cyclase [Variovorax paradoxus]
MMSRLFPCGTADPRRAWRLLVAAALALFLSAIAAAQPAGNDAQRGPLQIRHQPNGLPAVQQLQVFEDKTRSLDIEQVRTPPQEARFAFPDDPLRGKESDRVLWFKLQMRLADPADAAREWLMLVPTVSTHDLRFYGPYDEDGRALAAPVTTGMRYPWASRPAASEQMAWRFRLPGPGTYTVYFRVESTFARIYDVSVWDPADYLQSTQDKRMFDGVSYGVLIGLMVYGLVLFKVFGEGLYGFYMLSCACGVLALASINGHALRYPFAHWPAAAGFAYTAGPALWAICKLQFGRRLLRLRHFAPPLDWLVQAFTVALALAIPYANWGAHPLMTFRLVQISVVASTVVMVIGALIAMRRRYWPAVLYFFGVALLLAGIGAIVVASWGWIEWAPNQMNVSQGALVAELIVFAVAMGSRLQLVLRSEQALTARTQQLVEALGTDALTGAASRAGFESRGEEWLHQGQPFALMLLDLDGFKGVNDAHGHAAGDQVLIAIAQRLRQQLRKDDVVARLGGDEFAVLVLGAPSREVLSLMARRMIEAGSQPVEYEGRSVTVGMSLGIACRPGDGDTLARLLRAADRAMYHVKQHDAGPSFMFASDLAAAAAAASAGGTQQNHQALSA